ncbi:hypothetical protein [Actinoplanes subglobosus]|uniref:Uncharacterized protein n=1 Tax=Actinoplanes subglobosus TaxID=1547892 RepID=A0ABV8J5U6_9ACTN
MISLVFSEVEVAKTIAEWWQSRSKQEAVVTVLLPEGSRIECGDDSRTQLAIAMRRTDQQ